MQIKITKNNLPEQVSGWLTDAIQQGRFQPGDRLPSVEKLAEDLNVGRSSVREALRTLEARGVLSIVHGKGTFINFPRFLLGSSLNSFSNYIHAMGMEPSSVILKKEVIDPDAAVRQQLNLSEGHQVNHLYRLRLADDQPMAIESSYTPHDLFPDLLQAPWTIYTSLYSLLREKYGVKLYYCKQKISSVLISDQQHQLLQVPVGSPGLSVHETVYSEQNQPVEFTRIVYRGDRYEYNLTLPGDSGPMGY